MIQVLFLHVCNSWNQLFSCIGKVSVKKQIFCHEIIIIHNILQMFTNILQMFTRDWYVASLNQRNVKILQIAVWEMKFIDGQTVISEAW